MFHSFVCSQLRQTSPPEQELRLTFALRLSESAVINIAAMTAPPPQLITHLLSTLLTHFMSTQKLPASEKVLVSACRPAGGLSGNQHMLLIG